MTGALVGIETAALAALVWAVAVRARPAAATGARLVGIAALITVQALVLDGFLLGVLPKLWRAGQGAPAGLLWLTQATRAALLVPAFALWYGMSRDDLAGVHRGVLLAVALLALGFGAPLVGLGILIWLTGRSTWSRELWGWRRFAILLVGSLLLPLLLLLPHGVASDGRLDVRFSLIADPWQAALISQPAPPPLALELALTRPIDRIVQALLDLFRVQVVVLWLRALTLPMRLYGMSLKRRFIVNYIFVRSVPSVLASLTLLAAGWVALGVYQSGRARSEFDRTLARADAASAALLERVRTVRDSREALAALEAARGWLGPDGSRAHVVLRRQVAGRGTAAEALATAATPDRLLQLEPAPKRTDRFEGIVEDGAGLYLLARRATPDSSHTIDALVPLDSIYVARVAARLGMHLTLSIDRGFRSERTRARFAADTTGNPRIRVASEAGTRPAGLFLGRAYLPLGDWGAGLASGAQGAVAVEVRTSGRLLLASLRKVPEWLFSNIVMVGLLLALTTLVGIVEGIAVRSGRSVVQSIEDEVASIQQGMKRFGAGELGHRIPVRGVDELSALAGSFNEMAASLERQRAELAEKERLEEDLEVARSIQRRFLPQHPPSVPGLEVAGVSVPSREVGGDLYHYAPLAGGRLAVALGDVSGKSVPAALIMSNVMSALRAEAQHETEIERSLERINRLLIEQVEPGRFVTLFYGVVDPGARLVRYANAGHNPVLRVTPAGVASWLREGGVPLAVAATARYDSAHAPVEPGDVLVAYSDGVTEAEGPEQDERPELFGEGRLADVVLALRSRPVEAILEGVLDAVRRFADGRPQADDITLVVVRHAPGRV